MTDPLTQLWQIVAETLLQASAQEPEQLASAVYDAILADSQLSAALQADNRMVQINQGHAIGYQVLVEGGIAHIGTHYHVDGSTLKPLLEAVLRRVFQKQVGIPHNLTQRGTGTFVGRDCELTTLHERLQQDDRLALASVQGMSGVGKTELALQYGLKALQIGTYPGGVCWLRARQEVGTQIVEFARAELGLEPPEDLELPQRVRWCWQRWQEGSVLVVYDDVQDYQGIEPWLPPADRRFKVLLTTRLRLGSVVRELELAVLTEAQALELLRAIVGAERIDRELETAQRVCEWLGYLPLGLELAGRYLERKPNLSLAVLWERLQAKRLEAQALTKAVAGMTAQRGVAAAFELSWEELDAEARQVAGLLGLFAAAPIPWRLVQDCLLEWDEEELEDVRDERLLGLNLLQYAGKGTYQLHPLIREFFGAKLVEISAADGLRKMFAVALTAEAKTIPQTVTVKVIEEVRNIIPHMEVAAPRLTDWIKDEDVLIVFNVIAWFYEGQGIYSQVEIWYEQCVEFTRKRFGTDQHFAISLSNLAGFYRNQGFYKKAEELQIQAYSLLLSIFGADNPTVASSMNELAETYHLQGRYDEAIHYHSQAFNIRLRIIAKICSGNNEIDDIFIQISYLDLATSLNNIASVYVVTGKHEQAKELYQNSLQILERILDNEDSYIATTLNNLAELYCFQRRYSDAEPLYERSLRIRIKLHGDDHPCVGNSLNNLALCYQAQGLYPKAEAFFQRALEIYKHKFGIDNLTFANSLNNLASLYAYWEQWAESESLFLQALDIRQRWLNNNHPDLVMTRQSLEYLWQAMEIRGISTRRY